MLMDGLYGPLRLVPGSFQEMVLALYRDHERRRGLYKDLVGAIGSLKNSQPILDGLIEHTLMQPTQKGPSVSQRVAFIRSLQKVKWNEVFAIEDAGYADDRRLKEDDAIMKHYV